MTNLQSKLSMGLSDIIEREKKSGKGGGKGGRRGGMKGEALRPRGKGDRRGKGTGKEGGRSDTSERNWRDGEKRWQDNASRDNHWRDNRSGEKRWQNNGKSGEKRWQSNGNRPERHWQEKSNNVTLRANKEESRKKKVVKVVPSVSKKPIILKPNTMSLKKTNNTSKVVTKTKPAVVLKSVREVDQTTKSKFWTVKQGGKDTNVKEVNAERRPQKAAQPKSAARKGRGAEMRNRRSAGRVTMPRAFFKRGRGQAFKDMPETEPSVAVVKNPSNFKAPSRTIPRIIGGRNGTVVRQDVPQPITEEALVLMRRIKIVAQLDRVPSPLPGMLDADVNMPQAHSRERR